MIVMNEFMNENSKIIKLIDFESLKIEITHRILENG